MSMSTQQKCLASCGVVSGAARRRGGCGAGHDEQAERQLSRPDARHLRAVNAIGRSAPTVRGGERERTTSCGTVDVSGRGSAE